MGEKVLLVDDEVNVLQGYQRALRKRYAFEVASSGAEALQKIAKSGPFAVIVSDMRMPEMNGVQLLARVKQKAPDTVRLMLTGNADQQTAIDAINQGDIFRFLTKPCNKKDLAHAIDEGIRQYRLIRAEKDLLQQTLAGSIKVLTEVLALADPAAFGRTARLVKLTRGILDELGVAREWWLEPLVLLSQIGCVTLPPNVSKKVASGQTLDPDSYRYFARHPSIGADLLAKIPRLEEIAKAIRYQEKKYDGTGIPSDGVAGDAIPFGARLLKVALDFDHGEATGLSRRQCLDRMQRQSKWYDRRILDALYKSVIGEAPVRCRKVRICDLEEGMQLAEDLYSTDGVLLIAKGHSITPSVVHRLEHYDMNHRVSNVVKIVVGGEPYEPQQVAELPDV